MNLKTILVTVSVICFGKTVAQPTHTITGTVTDSAASPAEFGTATLFRLPDSAFVAYAAIDNGLFKFSEVEAGNYFLKTSCIGFEDKIENVTITDNLVLTIIVAQKPVIFKETEIVGYKNPFSYKNGNIKVTLENTVLSTIPTVIEILAKLPTVMVSGDRESISVIGKGNPVIYLDNQRITLNDLSVLSVNDIKSIEIINNPSTKYEAEGQAVILITRKTSNQQGSKIDITETASLKRFFENRAGISASIKKGKTELKGNLQYQHINRWEGLDGTLSSAGRDYYSGYGGTSIGPRKVILGGIGIYRQLKQGNYFSVNVNIRQQEEPFKLNTNSYQNQNGVQTLAETRSTNFSIRPYLNTNFNYFKKLDATTQVFLGGQYSHYQRALTNAIYNNYNNTPLVLAEQRTQSYAVDVAVARADFETNFKNHIKWENGAAINFAKAATLFDIINYTQPENTGTVYNYRENNQAAYSQVSGRLKKIEYMAGLRAENTVLQGGYKDSGKLLLDRNFIYLFPKTTIVLPLDSTKTFTLNYSRNIRRPDYANANQITNYLGPFLERSNNININPSLTHEISANLQYKNYSARVVYYQTKNPAYFITEYDAAMDKLRMINQNLSSEEGARLILALPYQHKNFTSSNYISANINRIHDLRATGLKTAPFYHIYTNNQLNLPHNYIATVIGWLTTKKYEGVFEHNQQFAVDISLTKTFKKGLSITVNAFDIFRSLDYKETFTVNGIYSSAIYYENVREFSIAIKYSIGKITDAKFRNKEVNDNGNRLN